jgi:5-methylcytosine-specific restriction endonuclease McrA
MDLDQFLEQCKINSASNSKEARLIIKDSYKKNRPYLDRAYQDFRDSEEGRKWVEDQLKRCESKCPECQYPLTETSTTIDHKQPRKLAVWLAYKPENLWLLCHNCNWAKRDKSWEEYLEDVKSHRGVDVVERILDLA